MWGIMSLKHLILCLLAMFLLFFKSFSLNYTNLFSLVSNLNTLTSIRDLMAFIQFVPSLFRIKLIRSFFDSIEINSILFIFSKAQLLVQDNAFKWNYKWVILKRHDTLKSFRNYNIWDYITKLTKILLFQYSSWNRSNV